MTMTEDRNTIEGLILDTHPDLKITVEKTRDAATALIRLAGLIDNYNSDFFRQQALHVLEAGFLNLIIDATGTTFLSSTGIGAFTALLKHIRQNRGRMIIYGMPAKIYDVFRLLGFTSFFEFCDTFEEAVTLIGIDREPERNFPKTIGCPICGRRLKALHAGRFRCPVCHVVMAVDGNGEVSLG